LVRLVWSVVAAVAEGDPMTECRPVVWLGSCLLALTPACIAAAVDSIDARSSVPLTDSTFGQVFASRLEGAEVIAAVGAPAAQGARGAVELVALGSSSVVSIARLAPADLLPNERSGFAVALTQDMVVVGSPFASSATGKVRLYERTPMGVGAPIVITSPDPSTSDAFGHAVAATGDWLAIGEPLDDDGGAAVDRGVVHLYRPDPSGAWVPHARIVAPDARAGDTFGYTLAMDENTLVVASRYADVGSLEQAGVVWTVELGRDGSVGGPERVQAPDPGAYEWFGASVAFEAGTLVVGVCRDTISSAASEQGTVRVFGRTAGAWSQRAMLVSPGASTQDRFGNSVAIDQGRILVGADGQDPSGVSLAGRLHLFRAASGGWLHDQAFETSDPGVNQGLGVSCALHGSRVLGGAPRRTPLGGVIREGCVSAWTLEVPCAADLDGNGVVDGPDLGALLSQWGEAGGADLNGDGSVGAADLGVMLAAWGACDG
jgi:hypothetical protein